ncbi:MAG: hypothetical protein SO487_05695, partial [Alloprevotella sp.]|nr:hypothetical protein [Alloprevotella sp.]
MISSLIQAAVCFSFAAPLWGLLCSAGFFSVFFTDFFTDFFTEVGLFAWFDFEAEPWVATVS